MFDLVQDHGARRVYSTKSGTLKVEVIETEHRGIKGGAMDVYVKNGWVPRFMERTLGIQVYLRLPDGTQVVDVFNPTIKRDAGEINFNWLLEATPENELRLLREVAYRFTAWVSMMRRDADALAERGE